MIVDRVLPCHSVISGLSLSARTFTYAVKLRDEEAPAPWGLWQMEIRLVVPSPTSCRRELATVRRSQVHFAFLFLSSLVSSKPRRDSGRLSSDHVALQSGQRPH